MSNEKMPGDDEVGYGKPPKATQFQKGISGNPRGRPKKAPDFDTELIRESKSLITINDNGQPKRISKLQGVVKQLTNKAMTGNITAARIYLAHHQQAQDRAALATAQRASDQGKTVRQLTNEELDRLILASFEEMEKKSGKGTVSSAE